MKGYATFFLIAVDVARARVPARHAIAHGRTTRRPTDVHRGRRARGRRRRRRADGGRCVAAGDAAARGRVRRSRPSVRCA